MIHNKPHVVVDSPETIRVGSISQPLKPLRSFLFGEARLYGPREIVLQVP